MNGKGGYLPSGAYDEDTRIYYCCRYVTVTVVSSKVSRLSRLANIKLGENYVGLVLWLMFQITSYLLLCHTWTYEQINQVIIFKVIIFKEE